jgi:hypothetical protein
MGKHISRLYKTYKNCFYLPVMNGLGAEPAARRGEEMRDNENELPIWESKCHATSILRLWLNQPLNVCALITPPTHEFSSGRYL